MKNLPLSLALAASSGIFTLRQRPADWSPSLRRAYIVAPGVALGAIGVLAVRKGTQKGRELAAAGTVDLVTPFTAGAGAGADRGGKGTDSTTAPSYVAGNASGHRTRVPAIALAVLAAAVGTTVSGLLALGLVLGLVLDERIETWLVQRGVAQPRRVMAVAAAVGSLVLDQAMDSKDSSKDSKDPGVRR